MVHTNCKKAGMTYAEAVAAGWKDEWDLALTMGYVSRKDFNLGEAECFIAGGSRKGQIFAFAPCSYSTQFCYRRYLRKEER